MFMPLFVLQLPQKTLARYQLTQEDWTELVAVLLDIDVTQTTLTDSVISLEDFCTMFRVAMTRFGRQDFLQSYLEDIRPRHMGPIGLAMEVAPTLDDAFAIWRDNTGILGPMLHVVERESPEERIYQVQVAADMGDLADPYLELVLLMTAGLARNLTCGEVVPEVHFTHAAPQAPEWYRDHIGLVPRFGQSENCLVFRKSETARANDYYAPLLYQQALRGIRDLQETLRNHERLSFRVRQLLVQRAELGLHPSVEEAAEHFCMSVRTFTRRLADEALTFRELRHEVQLQRAKHLLLKSRLPVKAIAEKVGFANVSAFSRAFHVACGRTPQEFRASDASAA